MKAVFERSFFVVNTSGIALRITSLVNYIKAVGFGYFLNKFGDDFYKVRYEKSYLPNGNRNESNRYDQKYILRDVQGRQYSPSYIVSQFETCYPDAAHSLWKKEASRYYRLRINWGCTGGQSKAQSLAGIHSNRFKKALWCQNETLKEAGVKPIRDIKSHYECPYDDDWLRKPEKNWKRFRKTQYK